MCWWWRNNNALIKIDVCYMHISWLPRNIPDVCPRTIIHSVRAAIQIAGCGTRLPWDLCHLRLPVALHGLRWMPSVKKGISWLDLIIYGGIGCAGQFLEAVHLHMKPMERDANEKRHDNTQAARTELNWKCFNFGAKKLLFSHDFMNLPLLN